MYVEVCAGFANRLRALVSGICAAEDIGKPLKICWVKGSGCGAMFTDIFMHDGSFEITTTPIDNARMCLSPDDWEQEKGHATILLKSYGQFHETDPSRWLAHLQRLKPLPEFQAVAAYMVPEHTVGVHIRRTDNKVSIRESPTKEFLRRMREYASDTRFFLATDDPVEVTVLQEAFGDRIIHGAIAYERHSLVGVQVAFLDFLCLSKCSEILGSVGSSFSEMAAAYGSKPLKLVKICDFK
jgi:hypothetical protein